MFEKLQFQQIFSCFDPNTFFRFEIIFSRNQNSGVTAFPLLPTLVAGS